METNLWWILFLMLLHFFADFGLQTDDQARQKYNNDKQLFYHVGVYSLFMFFGVLFGIYHNVSAALVFGLITFIMHFMTDYFTSKLTHHYFDAQDYHNGFIVIGADQFLHMVQILLTHQMIMTLLPA